MFAKAPTLAWLLTAAACFLTGLAVDEARRQALAPPALPTVGVVVTVEVAYPTAATSVPSLTPTPSPSPSCDSTHPGPPHFGHPGNVR